jgi:hypothetical protein
VSFALTADYGRDAAGGGVWWGGIGGYVRVRALPWLAATLRGERFADPGGFTTGTRQRVAEITGTIELRVEVSRVTLMSRLEYRRDQSDALVFEAAGPSRRSHQDSIGLGLIAVF